MTTRQAIEEAISVLANHSSETYPETIETLKSLLDQRGCEVFDPAVQDGRLTSLCDIIMFG